MTICDTCLRRGRGCMGCWWLTNTPPVRDTGDKLRQIMDAPLNQFKDTLDDALERIAIKVLEAEYDK